LVPSTWRHSSKLVWQDGLEHRHAGVVDQRVDAAEARHHGLHGAVHLVGLGDIGVQGQHMFGIGQRGVGGGQGGGIDVEQRHVVAVARNQRAMARPMPRAPPVTTATG
jgi:hypothetical protein